MFLEKEGLTKDEINYFTVFNEAFEGIANFEELDVLELNRKLRNLNPVRILEAKYYRKLFTLESKYNGKVKKVFTIKIMYIQNEPFLYVKFYNEGEFPGRYTFETFDSIRRNMIDKTGKMLPVIFAEKNSYYGIKKNIELHPEFMDEGNIQKNVYRILIDVIKPPKLNEEFRMFVYGHLPKVIMDDINEKISMIKEMIELFKTGSYTINGRKFEERNLDVIIQEMTFSNESFKIENLINKRTVYIRFDFALGKPIVTEYSGMLTENVNIPKGMMLIDFAKVLMEDEKEFLEDNELNLMLEVNIQEVSSFIETYSMKRTQEQVIYGNNGLKTGSEFIVGYDGDKKSTVRGKDICKSFYADFANVLGKYANAVYFLKNKEAEDIFVGEFGEKGMYAKLITNEDILGENVVLVISFKCIVTNYKDLRVIGYEMAKVAPENVNRELSKRFVEYIQDAQPVLNK